MPSQVTIIMESCPFGGYSAYIPEVPGVYCEAATTHEARAQVLDNLRDLMQARRDLILMQLPTSALVETAEL